MKRRKMGHRESKSKFSNTSGHHPKNAPNYIQRGGIYL